MIGESASSVMSGISSIWDRAAGEKKCHDIDCLWRVSRTNLREID